MGRVWPRRLSDYDLQELVRLRADVDLVFDQVAATNLRTKPVILDALVRDARILTRIFHRNWARLEIVVRQMGLEMPQDAPAELAAPAVQEQAQIVEPGKEEG